MPAVAGVTYDWVVTNGTITAGDLTRAITITAGTTGSVVVSVTETDQATGCVSQEASVSMPIAFLATGYYVFAPCRLFDTRFSTGPAAAAPALAAGETRTLAIGTRCGIPTSTVRSLAVNQTVTAPSADGELVLFRGDLSATPITSSLSYWPGKTRANNAILELSWSGDGTFKVHNRSTGSVHFILDVNGAFQRSGGRGIRARITYTSSASQSCLRESPQRLPCSHGTTRVEVLGSAGGWPMALNIRNPEAERLAEALARLACETKTEAVTKALRERLAHLRRERAGRRLADDLDEIGLHCSRLPVRDARSPEEILGYDENGVPR